MAIDRTARAKRRQAQRNAERLQSAPRPAGSAVLGVEGLFSAGAKHQLEHLAWVEVVKEDERESGGPLDLDADVVRLDPRN
ncbi:hypothetical protein SAMN05421805_108253 [Saccharopolyspora antimicrobica]|uniref:Uncharacterized protein n=1 Tax=Saccharopolyspora antimicrobica TaxID=455193 RepID=A0A1I5DSI7_9PSEU|nr:hypothetical protein [Saccharopolyspora antimicrobica]RKT85004.1 hypothetical protein ATL45_3337 [Saccharopolyspora antimicrobica]SFO02136.1 hypothetical protein SAMN05421805_108253 [Saccharopolyspora antimicrobica]